MQDFSELVGHTLRVVEQSFNKDLMGDEVLFTIEDGRRFKMTHLQNCSEHVYLEDVTGDLEDLIGHEILLAEQRVSQNNPKSSWDEAFLWTFYELRTVAASVTLRWYGTSNGYYSVDVSFMSTSDYEPIDSDTWQIAGDYVQSLGLLEKDPETGGMRPNLRQQYYYYFHLFDGK